MKHYLSYYKLSLITFAFLVALSAIKKRMYLVYAALVAFGGSALLITLFKYLETNGTGIWQILTYLQK